MKKILIHQPDFLPWCIYLDRWKRSDLMIFLDDVQFIRRGWQHRDKLILSNQEDWFGIPIKKSGHFNARISEIEIDYSSNWQKKIFGQIEQNYRKGLGFEIYWPEIKEILTNNYVNLLDLNLALFKYLINLFSIKTPFVFSSNTPLSSNSTQKLLQLCEIYNADCYLTGLGSKDYLDESIFNSAGIKIEWDRPEFNPFYPQSNKNEIGLSVLHFILKYGEPFND